MEAIHNDDSNNDDEEAAAANVIFQVKEKKLHLYWTPMSSSSNGTSSLLRMVLSVNSWATHQVFLYNNPQNRKEKKP
jgi:hypothetical protein